MILVSRRRLSVSLSLFVLWVYSAYVVFILLPQYFGGITGNYRKCKKISLPANVHSPKYSDGNHSLIFSNNLEHLNRFGGQDSIFQMVEGFLRDENFTSNLIVESLRPLVASLQFRKPMSPSGEKLTKQKLVINIASVVCGDRISQAMVMFKSVILFSLDSAPHLIIFSDHQTILRLGVEILGLKWTMNAIGFDFTFELHETWFPPETSKQWKNMYASCATQRLFFPLLLPEIDATIYLDTDVVVVSNLTQLWQSFAQFMGDQKMAALASNTEDTSGGVYNEWNPIPYYGKRGLNAGIMLMNLTQMRKFKFEDKILAAYVVYQEKLTLADQDILNILFHTFPEKLHKLDCTYNFYWVHCGYADGYNCIDEKGDNFCFCQKIFHNGVQIVHGNSGSFHSPTKFPHFNQLFVALEQYDLLMDNPLEMFRELQKKFKDLHDPCKPLTHEMMYNNALQYFQNLHVFK